ncbi:MAG: AcrR family transcriptional regulator [Zhongshania sp.]|jgi:AcrR family transcriptional regulator|nr:TetR/AcrR family transcriptional regulator [Zhongshania sp.]
MAKPVRNKQSYIDAAIAVIRDEGFESLSMRKVAAKLGVSAMAMYKHFPNKDALLSSALDDFIGRADVLPDKDMDWDVWLAEVARRMFLALSEEIDWVPLLGALGAGEQAAKVTAQFIEKLRHAGFTSLQATDAYFALIQCVIGAACLQVSLRAEKQGLLKGASVKPPAKAGSAAQRLQIDISMALIISALRRQLDGPQPAS